MFSVFVMAVLAKSQQSQRIRFLTPNSPHDFNRRVCYDCHYAYFLADSDQYKVFTTSTLRGTRQTNASHTERGAYATEQ
jgi:hypothetical protein